MLKDEHSLQPQSADTAQTDDELQHILIPACALGPEFLQRYRAANPQWRSQLLGPIGSSGRRDKCKSCLSCLQCMESKSANLKPQHANSPSVEGSAQMKVARPISISFGKSPQHAKLSAVVPLIRPFQHTQPQAIESPATIKAPQHRAIKATAVEDLAMMKASLHTIKPPGREALAMIENSEQTIKPSTREEYAMIKTPRRAMKHAEMVDPARNKPVELAIVPVGMEVSSEHVASSEEASEDTMIAPQMEAISCPSHVGSPSRAEVLAMTKVPKYVSNTPTRVDEPILVDDQGVFDFVVATRKIPNGVSYVNLDDAMQRKLHFHYKNNCPPCPHCNSSIYVKFRYFNNSGKSSLLQPRYTCRNPDTCLTVQEKSGKAGSRDFTLPRPRDAENHAGGQNASPGSVNHERVNSLQGRAMRQPQMIPRSGNKRPSRDLNPPSEFFERTSKLPNTTLSLQTLDGSGAVMDVASGDNLRRPETSNSKSLQLVKPTEDSSSSSSTQTASDEQTGINVRGRAEASSENGRLIVQPISVQKVAPTVSTTEPVNDYVGRSPCHGTQEDETFAVSTPAGLE